MLCCDCHRVALCETCGRCELCCTGHSPGSDMMSWLFPDGDAGNISPHMRTVLCADCEKEKPSDPCPDCKLCLECCDCVHRPSLGEIIGYPADVCQNCGSPEGGPNTSCGACGFA